MKRTNKKDQQMPTTPMKCPCCGVDMKLTYQRQPQKYADFSMHDEEKQVLELRRLRARCPKCGKRQMVPAEEVYKNTRMTAYLADWIKFLLKNPYGLTNQEIADEAMVSEKTIRRMRKGS